MKVAYQCESLFNQVAELGAGIEALGDMLGWAPDDACQDTLAGLGSVLRHLGSDMRGIKQEFISTGYKRLMELEPEKKNGSIGRLADAPITHAELKLVEKLRTIIDSP